jgi:alanyl-tRNA synthetase
MTYDELRKKFLYYWQSEPRSSKVVPDVSLVPNNDPTLLFVNSGMFPLAPYLAGQKHPLGIRLCNIQRCLRTKYDDMKEIGDNRHTSMFEMMGNWSLGDYTKVEQIPWMLRLHVEEYGLDPSRLYVTVYGGDEHIGRDDEAIIAWKKAFREYGIEAEFSEDITSIPSSLEMGKEHKFRIFPYGKKDNWWKRGDVAGELGGPSSELFYDTGRIERLQERYHINDDSGRFLEIGNSVFMEYRLDETLHWVPLTQKNIDFGGGLERVLMCIQDKTDIFETDLYLPIIQRIVELSGKEYKTDGKINEHTKYFRILADHGRAATFILADGVLPSNKDQGYILRRFIRRLVRFGMKLELPEDFAKDVAEAVIERMSDVYPQLKEREELILSEMSKEESKFRSTLQKGLKELGKIDKESFNGEVAFRLYETYGFPVEMMLDEIEMGEEEAEKLLRDFSEEERKHRELSKIGAEHKFKGGLADSSEITTRLHTAHHLLLRALQIVLGEV